MAIALGSRAMLGSRTEPRAPPPKARGPIAGRRRRGLRLAGPGDGRVRGRGQADHGQAVFPDRAGLRSAKNVAGWVPGSIGLVGNSVELLPSSNAVIGLRNGSLALYREPLAFAVTDPATNTVYRWKPEAGVTVLTVAGERLCGTQARIPARRQQRHRMGDRRRAEPGTCYWIYPLIRTARRG